MAEVGIVGPLAVEAKGSWIFDSGEQNVTEKGFALTGNIVFYFLQMKAFKGMWLKAHASFESFDATVSNSFNTSLSNTRRAKTGIFGAMIGNTVVFGQNGGFAISGGIGIGGATADPLTVNSPVAGGGFNQKTYFDKTGRIRLLGSFGLGVAF